MKKTILLISLLLIFSVTFADAQTTYVKLNPRSHWTRFYPNTKNIKADISASYYVEVFVVDGINLERFKRGQSYESYYNYGKIKSVSVNLNLRKGAYYLVVNNYYWIDSQDVQITLYR